MTSGGGGGGTSPTIQALGGMAGEGAAVVELVIEGGGGGCTLAADRGRSFSVQSHGSSGQFSTETPPIYRVLVLGSHGVGKTALVQQFMTSEFLGAVETSFGKIILLRSLLACSSLQTQSPKILALYLA